MLAVLVFKDLDSMIPFFGSDVVVVCYFPQDWISLVTNHLFIFSSKLTFYTNYGCIEPLLQIIDTTDTEYYYIKKLLKLDYSCMTIHPDINFSSINIGLAKKEYLLMKQKWEKEEYWLEGGYLLLCYNLLKYYDSLPHIVLFGVTKC